MRNHVASDAETQNLASARAYLAAFSTGDPNAIADKVAEDFVNDQPGELASGCRGREVYRQKLAGFLAAFEGLTYTIDMLFGEGNYACAAYTMRAKSDGYPIEIRGVMVLTLRDGLIAKRSDYWDGLSYLRQVGKVP